MFELTISGGHIHLSNNFFTQLEFGISHFVVLLTIFRCYLKQKEEDRIYMSLRLEEKKKGEILVIQVTKHHLDVLYA